MKSTFRLLQDQMGVRNTWLAETLGFTKEHISRMRNGRAPMERVTEVAMRALASGWRP